MKKIVAPWLPATILKRKKRGFGAPIGAWLRKDLQPMVAQLLSEEQVSRRGLFHWPAIKRLIAEHSEQRADHTDRLLALVMLELWCQITLDGNSWESVGASQSPIGSTGYGNAGVGGEIGRVETISSSYQA